LRTLRGGSHPKRSLTLHCWQPCARADSFVRYCFAITYAPTGREQRTRFSPGVNRCILTEHDHREQQRFLKTRYQNWPTETEAQNGAFALPFETRRQRNTSQSPRIRAHSAPNPKEMKKQRLAGWGGRTRISECCISIGLDPSLLRIVARAHDIQARLSQDTGLTVHDVAREEHVTAAYIYTFLRLPWLAPDITTAIVNGRQPQQLNAKTLMRKASRLPTAWAEQRRMFRF